MISKLSYKALLNTNLNQKANANTAAAAADIVRVVALSTTV
jgi:hypothetical protein